MKKLFPDEKGTKKGVKEFLDKRGFYIVLLLCIGVVAATALFVTTRNATSEQPDYEARNIIPEYDNEDEALSDGEDQVVDEAEADLLDAGQPEDKQVSATEGDQSDIGKPVSVINKDDSGATLPKDGTDTDKVTAPKAPTEPVKSTTPKASTKKATTNVNQSFQMPVTGKITLEYAMDKLVYSKTLEEWRAHSGVDIASERGTPVKAVADGTIIEVRNDSYYGISVVIDHGNDLKSLYRNLASDETVVVNQKIKQGEVIGSIGNTAKDESSEQPHLHFEVLVKDTNVDPVTYLPKSSANVD